jgi:hypothetical protein
MKTLASIVAIVMASSLIVSNAHAQRPRGGPPKAAGGASRGKQATGNQNGRQDMPSVEQLAQMMLGRFDADSNNALDLAELQNALTALRRLLEQGGQQDGRQRPQRDGGNQEKASRGRPNTQEATPGGRPPSRTRGNPRGGTR